MIDPAAGPYLFDTSAESWLHRAATADAVEWLHIYRQHHEVHISAITVIERVRGYALLWRRGEAARQESIEAARQAYLQNVGQVVPLDGPIAVVSGEIMGLLPDPPTPPRRSHQLTESRQERLARWRFDVMIAATALVRNIRLIHNNAADFEPIRSAIERVPARFHRLGPLELIRCTSLGAQ